MNETNIETLNKREQRRTHIDISINMNIKEVNIYHFFLSILLLYNFKNQMKT